jgi:hypothetical protein
MTLGDNDKYRLETPLKEYTDKETARYKRTAGRKP